MKTKTQKQTLNEIRNYRQIKVKYIPCTNITGSRICIYEPKRYNDDKTIRVYQSYSSRIGCIQEQAFQYLKEKGFNIIAKASEFENYVFLCDNWADEFRELKTGKIRTY
jgi:predicted small secreted protein